MGPLPVAVLSALPAIHHTGHSAFFVATFGPNLGIVPDMGTTWNFREEWAGRGR